MYHAIFVLMLLAPAASLEIVCGWHHTCVFERGQTAMKCWGWNAQRQLGFDDNNNRGDAANQMGSHLPFINMGTGFIVTEMGLGRYHSCAVSGDKGMKCFGRNAESQLGFDGTTTTGDALPFINFGANTNLSKASSGESHTCALSTESVLKCFGENVDGQCGAGTSTNPITGSPSQINAIDFGSNFTPIDVQTFYDHTCCLSQQQTVKCFGHNGYGQLGYGDTTDRGKTPESTGDGLPILDLGSNFIVAAIATGSYHTCALSTAKTVKCFGWNSYGQCGTPHNTQTGDNLPVLEFGAGFVPMQLALGREHTCVLSENATLICFGRNNYGQLGIGSTADVDTPSTLTGIDLGSDFMPRQIAAGEWHTCAVSTNDAVKCWGRNNWGQLGLGHTNSMGNGPNGMGDNLPIVDVAWPAPTPTIATSAPTTAPTTSKQPTVSPSTTTPTTTSPTTAQPSTLSPTTASPSATMASTYEPSTSSPTPPPVTASTAAQTTTTTAIWTATVAETTASSPAPSPSAAVTSSSTPTQTTVIIAACASAFFIAVVCICAAAFYYRKNYVRADRRLSENAAEAQLDEEHQHARNEIGNDAEVRVPSGVVAYARENAHVEDTRGEDNLSLPAQECVLSVDARRRENNQNIELAIAEVRMERGVFAHARENAHVEDTRGEDNLSLRAQESVLSVDEEEGIAAHNPDRRQSQQQHDGDAATLQTAVATSGATAGIDPSLGVYELNLTVDL